MIISILGVSGADADFKNCVAKRDENGNIQYKNKPIYDLKIFNKPQKEYINSIDFLLNNFNREFIFIGTKCAIKFQKDILSTQLKDKNYKFIEIQEDSLNDIFEKIFNILENTNSQEIILDITHGFRHQPIMAIFSSTLSQFLIHKNLKILFAKEIERGKKYEYIYLDNYIEITQLSLLLTGFIKTLNIIPTKKFNLIKLKSFEEFSKSLLSNDKKGVLKKVNELNSHISEIKDKQELKHLQELFNQIEKILQPLLNIENTPEYTQYMTLATLTLDKNYLVVSLAYMFESLREYCSLKFEPLLKAKNIHFKNSYYKNTATMDTIANFQRGHKKNDIQKAYPNLYNKNKNIFSRIDTIYSNLRELRNSLAHINTEKSFEDIKQDLNTLKFKIETIYKDDILKHINYESTNNIRHKR